jgi:hypothetical protein
MSLSHIHIKFMKKHIIQTIIFLLLFISGCLNKNIKISDFKTDGFLNNNIFQIILNIKPDDSKKGLIEKRESAYFKAKKNLHFIITDKIAEYSINFNKNKFSIKIDSKNLEKYKKKIYINFKDIYKKGYIVEEFYDDRQNLTFVYRIQEKNLKNRIEAFTYKLKEKRNYDENKK